jgi:hypothetical protein
MAALKYKVNIPSTPLTAGTAKTVCQVKAPANQRVKILGWCLSFQGSTAQLPIQVRFIRQTSSGTSLVAATPVALEPELTETIQSTCQVGSQTTQTEPSNSGGVLRTVFVPAYSGEEYLETPGNEDLVGGGGFYGLECLNPAGNTSNSVSGHVLCEE